MIRNHCLGGLKTTCFVNLQTSEFCSWGRATVPHIQIMHFSLPIMARFYELSLTDPSAEHADQRLKPTDLLVLTKSEKEIEVLFPGKFLFPSLFCRLVPKRSTRITQEFFQERSFLKIVSVKPKCSMSTLIFFYPILTFPLKGHFKTKNLQCCVPIYLKRCLWSGQHIWAVTQNKLKERNKKGSVRQTCILWNGSVWQMLERHLSEAPSLICQVQIIFKQPDKLATADRVYL